MVDPAVKRVVAQAKLGSGPDYVRRVAPLHEVWVSEPGSKVIETFRLEGKSPPKLTPAGTIEVPDGPESLEIDALRRRAYANTWHDVTVALDLDSRAIVARWSNGCQGAHGELELLGTVATAPDAHCVTADDAGNAYLCDPGKGRLLVYRDPYPASR